MLAQVAEHTEISLIHTQFKLSDFRPAQTFMLSLQISLVTVPWTDFLGSYSSWGLRTERTTAVCSLWQTEGVGACCEVSLGHWRGPGCP